MGRMRPKKRARKEPDGVPGNPVKEDNYIERIGVSRRRETNKFVVEMRPPDCKLKLNFGSYATEPEAMVARDYGACLRAFAGESNAVAGGFGSDQLYQFEESRAIFESMEETKVRRERFLPLFKQLKAGRWSEAGDPPHLAFCKDARKDIRVAIQNFHEWYPLRLATSRPTETRQDLPKVEPVDGGIRCTASSSHRAVRVSPEPTPGRGLGAITGDAASIRNWVDMSVQIVVAVNGSPFQILSDIKVLGLHDEELFRIIKGYMDEIKEELKKFSFEKTLETLPTCPVDPLSIPAIEFLEPET